MSKASRTIQIPDEVAEMLEAFAKAQGKTTSEFIVDIVTGAIRDHPFGAYIKDGVFDEKRFHADCQQTADAIERWDREHWDEVSRILIIGKRVHRRPPAR